jgi:two-component system chemotaxis response regulator CheY
MDKIILDGVAIPKNIKIFILEDTGAFQRKIREDLKALGFTGDVTLTATLKDALVGVIKNQPQLILSDWNLPDGKGIEFLKMVRGEEQFKKTPFVMITTVDEIENILEAVECGVDGYIVKPWELKEIGEKIAFAYDKHKKISLDL